MEADRPGKLFIGGLTREANENMLKAVFGRHGPVSEVLLLKDRRRKCRGFAFITFENAADAQHAARDWNGKFLDGKVLKVEQAKKPFFQSAGRQRTPCFSRKSRCTGKERSARGKSGPTRGWHPSRGGRIDDGEYTRDLNMSSFRGHFPVKRHPPLRSGGPYPKKSAPFTLARSNSGMRGQGPTSRGRDYYRGPLCRKSVSSWRCDHMSRKHDGYASKSRNNPSFRDTMEYVSMHRHYAYRDHARSREDKHSIRGYSDHDGYRRHGGRDHPEHHSRNSNRASYKTYRTSHDSAPAQRPWKTYGGSNCPDHNSTRDRYGRSWERYSRSHSDFCSSDGEHCGRKEPMCPPSMERVNRASREARGSSRY
ncbi:RNA-binding motif protein, X chromosome-like [Cebus imitator]|uniref:RNA-binding motif protein, X chromosome-like n=1 Tax=Cebus imitator TaxID=2715852 RepID=UPI000809E1BA|nr:RNA-binding motif protein, X chromosome-like [Cebus imitator]